MITHSLYAWDLFFCLFVFSLKKICQAISTSFIDDPSETPRLEGTEADIDQAISFAAFRMMLYLFSVSVVVIHFDWRLTDPLFLNLQDSNATMALITSFFTSTLSFNATLQSEDLSTPAGYKNSLIHKQVARLLGSIYI